jgi:hypothetical protein
VKRNKFLKTNLLRAVHSQQSHSSRLRVRKQNGVQNASPQNDRRSAGVKQNAKQNASPQNDRRSAGVKQNAKQNAPALHALAIFAPEKPAPYMM